MRGSRVQNCEMEEGDNHVLTIDNYMFQRYNFNEIRQKLKTAEKH